MSGRSKRQSRLNSFNRIVLSITKNFGPLPGTKQYINNEQRKINNLGVPKKARNNEWRTYAKNKMSDEIK